MFLIVTHVKVNLSTKTTRPDNNYFYSPLGRLSIQVFQLLCIPRSRHSWGRRSFSSSGPELWNSLPPHLRNENSYSQFKSLLKNVSVLNILVCLIMSYIVPLYNLYYCNMLCKFVLYCIVLYYCKLCPEVC